MSNLNETTKQSPLQRLALHYLSELEAAENNYLISNDSLTNFSSASLGDWEQIKPLQQWAVKNSVTNKVAMQLCNDFAERAPNLLGALQGPDDRIDWLREAKHAAHQLGLEESEIAHLGNMAIISRNAGRNEQSIKLCRQLHEMFLGKNNEEDANALTMLGESLRTDGRYAEEAIDTLKQALEVAKDKWYLLKDLTYHNLGITYRNLGKIQLSIENHEAEKESTERTGDLVGVARANLSLGIIKYEQLEINAALDHYTKARDVAELAEADAGVRSAYIYHVNPNSLKAELTHGISTESWQKFNRIPIFGNRGVALAMIGRYDDALDSLIQAIRLSKDTGHTRFESVWRYQKGIVHYYIGEYEIANGYFKRSLELAIKPPVYRAQGFALAGLGRTQLAICSLDPNNSKLEVDRLVEAFEIALRTNNPRDLQDWGVTLAEGYLFNKRVNDARAVIDQILHLDSIENRYRVLVLDGIVNACMKNDLEKTANAFKQAVTAADQLLAATPNLVTVKFARGLALSGFAAISQGEQRADFIAQAQQTFLEARSVASAAGVVNDILRLFESFTPLIDHNELAPVRQVIL